MISVSRGEWTGLGLGIVMIAIMAFIVFHGPFYKINKTSASGIAPKPAVVVARVKIVNDPKAIGRYTPHTVTIHVGQAVTFTNVSSTVHTVTADNNAFNSGDIAISGNTWKFAPHKTGTFSYFCIYHPLMHGVLVVQ